MGVAAARARQVADQLLKPSDRAREEARHKAEVLAEEGRRAAADVVSALRREVAVVFGDLERLEHDLRGEHATTSPATATGTARAPHQGVRRAEGAVPTEAEPGPPTVSGEAKVAGTAAKAGGATKAKPAGPAKVSGTKKAPRTSKSTSAAKSASAAKTASTAKSASAAEAARTATKRSLARKAAPRQPPSRGRS